MWVAAKNRGKGCWYHGTMAMSSYILPDREQKKPQWPLAICPVSSGNTDNYHALINICLPLRAYQANESSSRDGSIYYCRYSREWQMPAVTAVAIECRSIDLRLMCQTTASNAPILLLGQQRTINFMVSELLHTELQAFRFHTQLIRKLNAGYFFYCTANY